MIQAGYVRNVEPRSLRGAAAATAPTFEPEVLERRGGAYGAERRPRWVMLTVILGLHALLFAALAIFDVVHVGPKKMTMRLTVVELQPDPVAAPPPAPKQQETPTQPNETPLTPPIVAPPPIVQAPAAAVPVLTVAQPAPPPPSAPAPAAAPSAEAAPITPPDASARNLGNVAPKYPMQARLRHWEGTIRLKVLITPEGRVKDISVARSSGFDVLDDAALETVRKWKFEPGKQAGVPVEAVGFLNIPFRLT